MQTTELRTKLHASIDQIEDEEMLLSILDILNSEKEISRGLLQNASFLHQLEKGIDDINNKRTISLNDSNKKIDEWLMK
jgi:hypothetical protein